MKSSRVRIKQQPVVHIVLWTKMWWLFLEFTKIPIYNCCIGRNVYLVTIKYKR